LPAVDRDHRAGAWIKTYMAIIRPFLCPTICVEERHASVSIGDALTIPHTRRTGRVAEECSGRSRGLTRHREKGLIEA
jgi:hypothetical protein